MVLDRVLKRGGEFGGAYYFEDVRYYFVGWDMAVVLEELAGLWTDGFEVGFVPLYIFVLSFDVRVHLWYGHARREEGRGASGGLKYILQMKEYVLYN